MASGGPSLGRPRSAPSTRISVASGASPARSSTARRGTPFQPPVLTAPLCQGSPEGRGARAVRLFPAHSMVADQGARPQLLEVCQGEVEGASDGALDGDAVGGRVEVGDGEVAADVEGWGGGDLRPQPFDGRIWR